MRVVDFDFYVLIGVNHCRLERRCHLLANFMEYSCGEYLILKKKQQTASSVPQNENIY